jgi:hypothetical protein
MSGIYTEQNLQYGCKVLGTCHTAPFTVLLQQMLLLLYQTTARPDVCCAVYRYPDLRVPVVAPGSVNGPENVGSHYVFSEVWMKVSAHVSN